MCSSDLVEQCVLVHPMMCLKQKLFDQNGEVDEDALLYEVHSDLRDFVLDNLAKKEKQVLDALRIPGFRIQSEPENEGVRYYYGTNENPAYHTSERKLCEGSCFSDGICRT